MTSAHSSLFRRKVWSQFLVFLVSLSLSITLVPATKAAPNADLKSVRAQVEQLQEDAAEAGENAQAAKIQLAKLKKQLSPTRSRCPEANS
jgi:outer membrane murein-binding lipoprotein Lpp